MRTHSVYLYFRISESLDKMLYTPGPFHLISEDYEMPEFRLEVGVNPTFLLEKDGNIQYAVVNGFFIDLNQGAKSIIWSIASKKINGMIYR